MTINWYSGIIPVFIPPLYWYSIVCNTIPVYTYTSIPIPIPKNQVQQCTKAKLYTLCNGNMKASTIIQNKAVCTPSLYSLLVYENLSYILSADNQLND